MCAPGCVSIDFRHFSIFYFEISFRVFRHRFSEYPFVFLALLMWIVSFRFWKITTTHSTNTIWRLQNANPSVPLFFSSPSNVWLLFSNVVVFAIYVDCRWRLLWYRYAVLLKHCWCLEFCCVTLIILTIITQSNLLLNSLSLSHTL